MVRIVDEIDPRVLCLDYVLSSSVSITSNRVFVLSVVSPNGLLWRMDNVSIMSLHRKCAMNGYLNTHAN